MQARNNGWMAAELCESLTEAFAFARALLSAIPVGSNSVEGLQAVLHKGTSARKLVPTLPAHIAHLHHPCPAC